MGVLAWSMWDPLRNLADDGWSGGGTRSMYCSPMADTLFTVAVTFDGIVVPLFSRISAVSPLGFSDTDSTRPTASPRIVTVALLYRPTPATKSALAPEDPTPQVGGRSRRHTTSTAGGM